MCVCERENLDFYNENDTYPSQAFGFEYPNPCQATRQIVVFEVQHSD